MTDESPKILWDSFFCNKGSICEKVCSAETWSVAAVLANAEAALVEEPSAHKLEGGLAVSTNCTTVPGDESAARTSDGAVAALADTASVPVEGFTASDTTNEETAASAIGGVAAALAESALLCHAEHALRDPFVHGSPVPLIVTYVESDSCA